MTLPAPRTKGLAVGIKNQWYGGNKGGGRGLWDNFYGKIRKAKEIIDSQKQKDDDEKAEKSRRDMASELRADIRKDMRQDLHELFGGNQASASANAVTPQAGPFHITT